MKRKEIWKDIPEFENLYQISNYGRIFSIRRNKIRKLHNVKGYYHIILCNNAIDFEFKVHRLVAKAFIPNPKNKPEVNHKKGIKTDNRAWMLEWCTTKENAQHAFKTGLRKATPASFKLGCIFPKRRKKVFQYTLNGKLIKKFSSLTEASKSIKKGHSQISRCINKKIDSAFGFIWKYKK